MVQKLIPFVAPFRLFCCFLVANLHPKQVPVQRLSVGALLPPWSAPNRSLHQLTVVSGPNVESVPEKNKKNQQQAKKKV
jgi:hypothetical protein